MYQIVEQARKSNGNPLELFKKLTSNYSNEQLDSIYSRAKQMGVPEDYINQVKESINTNSVDIKANREEVNNERK